MKRFPVMLALAIAMQLAVSAQTRQNTRARGWLLENLTWVEAEKVLTPETVVVLPLRGSQRAWSSLKTQERLHHD